MDHFLQLLTASPHKLGLVGLVLNTAGAFLLIPFPPDLKGYRSNGTLAGPPGLGWSIWPTDGKMRYHIQKTGFLVTIAMLVIGFALQFFDLVYT